MKISQLDYDNEITTSYLYHDHGEDMTTHMYPFTLDDYDMVMTGL